MLRTLVAGIAALAALALLTPVLLAAAALWVVAASTRALTRLLEPAFLTRDQLIAFDPVFGWRPVPNLDTYHLMGDLFHIKTDAQGWRGRSTTADSDIVVFGDSFAAGYGVDEKRLFANLMTKPRVKAVGIGGYSMVQELLWMRELAPELGGKLVVWFVYFGNDLFDNLSADLRGYRKPFVRENRARDGWQIVSSHISAARWPIPGRGRKGDIHMCALAELCSNTFLAQRAYRACAYLLQQGRDICRAAGAELAVLTIPDVNQLSPDGERFLRSLSPQSRTIDVQLPERLLGEMCGSLRVPFVHGSAFLDPSCYKTNDCHWNERGHRRVARALSEFYESLRAPQRSSERVASALLPQAGEHTALNSASTAP